MINHHLLGLKPRPPSAAVGEEWNDLELAAMGRHVCFGKGGGQSAAPTTTTVNQNKLPDYAQPYVTSALEQGQALGQQSYTPYPGQQLADWNSYQQQALDAAGNLPNSSSASFSGAQSLLGQAGQMAANTGYNAGNYGGSYTAGDWRSPGVAQSFMDPYTNAVTNETIQQIRDQSGMMSQQDASKAQAAGGFGGYRDAIMNSQRDYNTMRSVGEARAKGNEASYLSGMGQFNTQQQALQAQNQQGIASFQANEAAKQAAAQARLAGGQLANTAGQNLGYLGTSQNNAALQNQQALQSAGGVYQAQQQSGLNIGYQNFLNQLNFPYQQLGFQSALINGLPVGTVGTSAQYQNPNTVSQMLGLGLGGLGLSKALGGG